LLPTTNTFHVEHIISANLWGEYVQGRLLGVPAQLGRNGPDNIDNYAWSCPYCNERKGDAHGMPRVCALSGGRACSPALVVDGGGLGGGISPGSPGGGGGGEESVSQGRRGRGVSQPGAEGARRGVGNFSQTLDHGGDAASSKLALTTAVCPSAQHNPTPLSMRPPYHSAMAPSSVRHIGARHACPIALAPARTRSSSTVMPRPGSRGTTT